MRTHYQNLKVAEDAPPEVIKAAWRALSQQYHPDRNPNDPNASKVMQIINEAYEVLSDPDKRRAHDNIIQKRRVKSEPAIGGRVPEPKATKEPQPRLWKVFDGDVTGPFTLAELAAKQRSGQIAMRTFVADWGTEDWLPLRDMLQRINKLPGQTLAQEDNKSAQHKGVLNWVLCKMSEYPRLSVAVVIYIILLGMNLFENKKPSQTPAYNYPAAKPNAANAYNPPPSYSLPSSSPTMSIPQTGVSPLNLRPVSIPTPLSFPTLVRPVSPPSMKRTTYVRPAKTPQGYLWPDQTDYLPGCPVLAVGGYCQVTVDNTRNSADVHVKLVNSADSLAVRECFIHAGSSMLMDELKEGAYHVRYRNLDTGNAARADTFSLNVERTAQGYSYSIITLTLYQVLNGNVHMTPLNEGEF